MKSPPGGGVSRSATRLRPNGEVTDLQPCLELRSWAANHRHLRTSRFGWSIAQLAAADAGIRFQVLHFVMRVLVPEVAWSWLGLAAKRLRRTARRVSPKLPRLQPVERLERLGRDLMASAHSDAGQTLYKRAMMFRDGLLIALLVRRPLRLKNLAALTLGTSLVLAESAATIVFGRDQMKGQRSLDIPFPTVLWDDLQTYLPRPFLRAVSHVEGADAGAELWISNEGSQMKEHAIKKRTQAAFGRDLCPHRFRDCAVRTVVRKPSRSCAA